MTKNDYEQKAAKYAKERGIIFYEVEGNIMRYEEQVQNGPRTYGIYNAEINLDTGEIVQVEAWRNCTS